MRLSLDEISRTPIINIFLYKTSYDAMKVNKIVKEISIAVTVIIFVWRLNAIEWVSNFRILNFRISNFRIDCYQFVQEMLKFFVITTIEGASNPTSPDFYHTTSDTTPFSRFETNVSAPIAF